MNERSASLFLMLLLCADLAFIALYSIDTLTPFLTDNPLYELGRDRGYPELFQYLKWLWIIILLIYVSASSRSLRYIAWGLVFTYFLCDDAFSIHEKIGKHLAENLTLTPPFGLRLRDLGELAVSAAAGVILSSVVIWTYVPGSQSFKKFSQDMLLLILVLAFFGVVVDMVDIAIEWGWTVEVILSVIEDGGEMLVASLIAWYVFLQSVRDEDTGSYLRDLVRLVLTRRSS